MAGSDVFDNDAFSIAFVFQLDCSVGCSVFSNRNACNFGDFFDVRGTDTGVIFEVSNATSNFVVGADTLPNEFNYYAAVQDGQLTRIFMNGQFIEESTKLLFADGFENDATPSNSLLDGRVH